MSSDPNDAFKDILRGDIEDVEKQLERRRLEYRRQNAPPRPGQSAAEGSLSTERLSKEAAPEAQVGDDGPKLERTTVLGVEESGRSADAHAWTSAPSPSRDDMELHQKVSSLRIPVLPDATQLSLTDYSLFQSRVFEAARPNDALDEIFAGILALAAAGLALIESTPGALPVSAAQSDADRRFASAAKLLGMSQEAAILWLSQNVPARARELETAVAAARATFTSSSAKVRKSTRTRARKKAKDQNGAR